LHTPIQHTHTGSSPEPFPWEYESDSYLDMRGMSLNGKTDHSIKWCCSQGMDSDAQVPLCYLYHLCYPPSMFLPTGRQRDRRINMKALLYPCYICVQGNKCSYIQPCASHIHVTVGL